MNLYPFQKTGILAVLGGLSRSRGFLLADEMGLGKTVQAVHVMSALVTRSCLVVCPAIMREKWAREIRDWTGMPSVVIRDGKDPAPNAGIVIVSYDLLIKRPDLQRPFDLVILDEAHYVKNVQSQRSQIFRKTPLRDSGKFLLLTGTPLVNARASEIWPLLHLCDPERAGKYSEFCRLFGEWGMTRFGAKEKGVKPWMVGELKKRLDGIFLRREKSEVLFELPPAHHTILNLSPKIFERELKAEEAILSEVGSVAWGEMEGKFRRIGVWGQLEKIRGLMAEKKVPFILDWLQDIETRPIVAFGIHVGAMKLLSERLQCPLLYGQTPTAERERIISEFQEGKHEFLVISARAGGVGIDLTRAEKAIFLELDYSPAVMEQASARLHRIGQRGHVQYFYPVVTSSLEERIASILAGKIKMNEAILTNAKNVLS